MSIDVTMPDGTVIRGVPDGVTQSQLAAKYQAHLTQAGGVPEHNYDWLHALALGGRAVGQGVFNSMAAVPDALINVGNMGIQAANEHLGTHIPIQRTFSGDLNDVLNRAGAPNPETKGEHIGTAVTQFAAGALTNPYPILGLASKQPPVTPSQADQVLADAAATGIDTTAGQATGSRMAQGLEAVLGKSPGGAGPMAAAGQKEATQMQAALDSTASELSGVSSAEQAGRSIQRGISGPGGFVDKFKETSGKLYDQLDNYIAPTAPVPVAKTEIALRKLNSTIPGAPKLSQFFINGKMVAIEDALKADLNASGQQEVVNSLGPDLLTDAASGQLPYVAVKKLRTLVGDQLADWSATSDVPRSKWKALYGALTEDMGAAATEAGPDATRALNRANLYYSAGRSRLDAIDAVVNANGGAENIFKAAMSGTREGATRLRAVMQSLPEDAQKDLSATVIRRMGQANPSAQNDVGDVFSVEKFLTNWNTVSPEAKATLFDRYGTDFSSNMDRIARVANRMRQSSQAFRNPSGTGQAVANYSALTAFLGFAGTGHFLMAGGIAGMAGASNVTARLMTNPGFVQWLATSSKLPASMAPMMVGVLAQQGKNKNDPDLVQAAQALQPPPSQQGGYE